MQLPDFGRDDVLIRLKAEPRTRRIPVIMISADTMDAQIKRLKALGTEAYPTKPFDVAKFLRTIDAVLAGA